jgi:hypothetical protein
MEGVFTMMVPDLKQSTLIQHLNMVRRVNKMLSRIDAFGYPESHIDPD